MTKSDDEKQNKTINNNIEDKSDDSFFILMLKIYELLFGKKKLSEKDVSKENSFSSLLFVLLSLIILIFDYLIFKK